MGKSIYDDLFGKGNPDSFDLFGDLFGKSKTEQKKTTNPGDPRRDALLKTFRERAIERDIAYLRDALDKYRKDVFSRSHDVELLGAYGLAALFVEDFRLCYNSFSRFENPNPRVLESRGIVSYSEDEYARALIDLSRAGVGISPSSKIAYVLSTIKVDGNIDLSEAERLLHPSLEKASVANSILGILNFYNGNCVTSKNLLERAVQLNPTNENRWLDFMRLCFFNGEKAEVYAMMNDFFVQTQSGLSAAEVHEQLETRTLQIPKFKIKNLYEFVVKLLA